MFPLTFLPIISDDILKCHCKLIRRTAISREYFYIYKRNLLICKYHQVFYKNLIQEIFCAWTFKYITKVFIHFSYFTIGQFKLHESKMTVRYLNNKGLWMITRQSHSVAAIVFSRPRVSIYCWASIKTIQF